ncbi:MAG: hypothetical protein QOI21_1050 [Actinomycetota bacterium]|nr:hypothetical protein [Actinomycetota bacterium]
MASAEQTLHDFVLDLLSNDTARSAFGADPSAALAGAGLHDVTPQDVQEVIPLVLDYAPAGLALPDTGAADSAIQQLQAVAHAADIHGLPNFEAPSPGTFGGGFGGETPLGDYTFGLDASSTGVSGVAGLTGGTVGAESGFTAGLDGFAAGGSSASPLGDFAIDTSGVPLALPIPALPIPALPAVPATPRFDSLGDPTAALDTDASAGTVASYVSAGGDVLASHVDTSSATLGSYLTGTGVPVLAGDTVSQAGYDAAAHVSDATNDVSGHLGSLPVPAAGALPAVPGLPGLPGLPELPAVPALPGVPDLHSLPVHLPQLPVDLPHVPAELPHLPVANPLPDLGDSNVTGALGDAASHSPLGEVASPDHLALPHLVDAPTDLLLGH